MILITYGTRPEYIKVKPLMEEMTRYNIPFKSLFTGQHEDIVHGEPTFSYKMNNQSDNRLDSIIKNCMSMPEEWFAGINYVLVQGDTTSVVGLALMAMHRKIRIIHLEAGLRSHNTENPYPEEHNRKIVSSIASLHLCPTDANRLNLLNEGINKNLIFVVGNTGLDNLVDKLEEVTYTDTVLITLHRRENHDLIEDWFREINNLAWHNPNINFIFPIHPNPNVKKHIGLLKHVNVVEPLSHSDLIDIIVKAKLVITDSGGIQEECSFFDKKCLVCRKFTERPEAVGKTSFLVDHPFSLASIFYQHFSNYHPEVNFCPFGKGNASKNICEVFKSLNQFGLNLY